MPRRLVPLILLLAGCGVQIPPVTPELVATAQARGLTTDVAQLERGRATYTRSCNACHSLHDPLDVTVARWPDVLAIMGPRAYLTDTQKADVLAFLTATGAVSR